jgi:hypothetical protein
MDVIPCKSCGKGEMLYKAWPSDYNFKHSTHQLYCNVCKSDAWSMKDMPKEEFIRICK